MFVVTKHHENLFVEFAPQIEMSTIVNPSED